MPDLVLVFMRHTMKKLQFGVQPALLEDLVGWQCQRFIDEAILAMCG